MAAAPRLQILIGHRKPAHPATPAITIEPHEQQDRLLRSAAGQAADNTPKRKCPACKQQEKRLEAQRQWLQKVKNEEQEKAKELVNNSAITASEPGELSTQTGGWTLTAIQNPNAGAWQLTAVIDDQDNPRVTCGQCLLQAFRVDCEIKGRGDFRQTAAAPPL